MYKLIWTEYHNPLNWGETEKKGIACLRKCLPTKSIHPDLNENDGWVECDCELKAKTLKEAIELAEENCVYNGSDVFSILDSKNKVVFTEENLE